MTALWVSGIVVVALKVVPAVVLCRDGKVVVEVLAVCEHSKIPQVPSSAFKTLVKAYCCSECVVWPAKTVSIVNGLQCTFRTKVVILRAIR